MKIVQNRQRKAESERRNRLTLSPHAFWLQFSRQIIAVFTEAYCTILLFERAFLDKL